MDGIRTLVHDAIDALNVFDRRRAVSLLREYFRTSVPSGERWMRISQLCGHIGEIDLAIEAARRYAATEPVTASRVLMYCSELAARGRPAECLKVLDSLGPDFQTRPEATHMRATIATQLGDFAAAEPLSRQSIDATPLTGQNWLLFSVLKKFAPGDPDLRRMESLVDEFDRLPSSTAHAPEILMTSSATFFYALGKARHDVGDYTGAFRAYSAGAALKRKLERFDAVTRDAFTRDLISGYTPAALSTLKPSRHTGSRALFVTGLPRSGTTLVEQILTSHSAVAGGAELNLFRAALIPAGNYLIEGARNYQSRSASDDPWGDVAADYDRMLQERFGPTGLVVDKTLNHSRFMGLLLHVLPKAKVVWLIRDPEDNAISVFRNYFASPVPWSYDLADIATYFKSDEALRKHWIAVFGDRILTVPYEGLSSEPEFWIRQILDHFGLSVEADVFEPHKQDKRSVMTASVAQVREPISGNQIGAARKYDQFLGPFRSAFADA